MYNVDENALRIVNLIYERKILKQRMTIKELVLIYKIEKALYEFSRM